MNQPDQIAVCKQHPDRVGPVRCQRCEAPMCPSCMHQASVGWHCPDCVRGHQRQARPAQRAVQRAMHGHQPVMTVAIMIVCGLLFLWDAVQGANVMTGQGSVLAPDTALFAPSVELRGEWYRFVSSAFTHSGLIHIGFNMWLLWVLGQSVEGSFGTAAFTAIYFAGILGGGLGAILIEPRSSVVGASGAVFALMGVVVVLQRKGGINVFQSGIGSLILINVLLSFRGGISLGGHLGGLAIGLVLGVLAHEARTRGGVYMKWLPAAALAVAAVVFIAILPALDRALNAF